MKIVPLNNLWTILERAVLLWEFVLEIATNWDTCTKMRMFLWELFC